MQRRAKFETARDELGHFQWQLRGAAVLSVKIRRFVGIYVGRPAHRAPTGD